MHCHEVHLHDSPLLLAQIAFDFVQHAAADIAQTIYVHSANFNLSMATAALCLFKLQYILDVDPCSAQFEMPQGEQP